MSGLRAGLDEMAADTPVYGDLDRAIQQAGRERRRNALMVMGLAAAAAVVVIVGVLAVTRDRAGEPQPAGPPTTTDTTVPALSALEDGPLEPGRYRYVLRNICDDPPRDCPTSTPPPPLNIDVTVPAGWDAATEFHSLFPTSGRDETSRNDPALALGWTNFHVGLNSEPCSSVSHQRTDIKVGPTVEDFVDAVVAHPLLNITEPKPVRLGSFRGQYFSLIGPSDISDCEEWRPWDPAPYLQGPANRWDIWVIDVDGFRVLIMAEYFPETPKAIKAELHDMAESVRFEPSKA